MPDDERPSETQRVRADTGGREAEDRSEKGDQQRDSRVDHLVAAESARKEAERFRVLAEEARVINEKHREALESVRREREDLRHAAEEARTAAEEARNATIAAVAATADALSSNLAQMQFLQDARKTIRTLTREEPDDVQ